MESRKKRHPGLVLSRRIRQTPFESRVIEQGAQAFTVYNQMPLASYFRSLKEDYDHLRENVQIWDVSCERQVEIAGPDALALTELITPRDISRCGIGQCMYAPLVDEGGGIVNDPIILRLDRDRFWLSIADSGVMLWVKGIAYGRGFDVEVFEPDVSPLAIQGPRSDDLMAELLGEHVRDIPFFRFIRSRLAETSFYIARSGWSGQGGFEIYLEEFSKGEGLWDCIWNAGQKYNIRAGCPNLIDRTEKGLLSYGSDMRLESNPYECGLDRFFGETKKAECMSSGALAAIRARGPSAKLVFLAVEGEPLASPRNIYPVLDETGRRRGHVTSLAHSARFGTNLAIATVDAEVGGHGQILWVDTGDSVPSRAVVKNRFWK